MQSTPSSVRPTLTPSVPPGGLGPLIPKLGGGRPAPLAHVAFAAAFLTALADWLVCGEHTGLSLTLLVAAISAVVLTFGRHSRATAAMCNALYVDAYGVTELRLATFFWMGLVALGLTLIIARIAWRKSGAWLVGRNTVALIATLITATLLNTTVFIADYNVAKWLGDPNRLTQIDTEYLTRLGPHAISAVDRLLAAPHNLSDKDAWRLFDWRWAKADAICDSSADWRAFTLRDARLAHYLSTHDITHSGPAALPEH